MPEPHVSAVRELSLRKVTVLAAAFLGGIMGAIIGAGISLALELFYSSANLLIIGVVSICSVLGAVFAHLMASLLAEDAEFAVRAMNALHAGDGLPAEIVDFSDHRALRTEGKSGTAPLVLPPAPEVSSPLQEHRPAAPSFRVVTSVSR